MPVEGKSRTRRAIVLLAGPTASGKSRLALAYAVASGAVIVNADSMQVYRDLRVLTARPSAEDERAAPHRLYGHVDAATRYSVGAWLRDFAAVLADAQIEGRPLIAVGGTGLYFKALTDGLAQMPTVPADLRAKVLTEAAALSVSELHERLMSIDPEDAAHIRPTDRARIIRALEVVLATGRPLAAWRRTGAHKPLIDPAEARRVVLTPNRDELLRRIGTRTEAMLAGDALAEAVALHGRNLPESLPAMKAIGVREVGKYLAGSVSLAGAAEAINLQTRRYAKRQMTWFRNQMADWEHSEGPLDLGRLPA